MGSHSPRTVKKPVRANSRIKAALLTATAANPAQAAAAPGKYDPNALPLVVAFVANADLTQARTFDCSSIGVCQTLDQQRVQGHRTGSQEVGKPGQFGVGVNTNRLSVLRGRMPIKRRLPYQL